MLACGIHRGRGPQQCSSGMSKEGFSTSQQDQEFQSKSHQSAEKQQFVHHGIQMSKITSKHTGEASEKVKQSTLQSTRDPFSLQGCWHLCHCCLLPPLCEVSCSGQRKGQNRKKISLSDSDDCHGSTRVGLYSLSTDPNWIWSVEIYNYKCRSLRIKFVPGGNFFTVRQTQRQAF